MHRKECKSLQSLIEHRHSLTTVPTTIGEHAGDVSTDDITFDESLWLIPRQIQACTHIFEEFRDRFRRSGEVPNLLRVVRTTSEFWHGIPAKDCGREGVRKL